MSKDYIVIKGAREHNLKDISLSLPRDKLITITGLSGSGKSSLAFDTIYAEGQRRYVESLSAYARQFLGLMNKPDVDLIEGLSPAISIEQKSVSKNPRSTVGTVTEIYDYLRLLFARIGKPFCPNCGKEISRQSLEQIVDSILKLHSVQVSIFAPVISGMKGEHAKIFETALADGYSRVRVDGELFELPNPKLKLDKNKKHNIELLIDRLQVKDSARSRLSESVEAALRLGKGTLLLSKSGKDFVFSEKFACVDCGISFKEMSPRMFSFNSPHGACPHCQGIGSTMEIDVSKIIPDRSKSIADGAIAALSGRFEGFIMQKISSVARAHGVDIHTPVSRMDKSSLDVILQGSGRAIKFSHRSSDGSGLWEYEGVWEGVVPYLKRRYMQSESDEARARIEKFMSQDPCPLCLGARLKKESLSVRVGGKNIFEATSLSVLDAKKFFESLSLSKNERFISKQILKEILARLSFLENVGLGYLTLGRNASTLSGGESQRIHLATQIGSSLVGVLYILDEPSIGLHQRDNARLLDTLKTLRDLGNTVIVVEHDEETILSSDFVVDMGPGAGIHGGQIVSTGSPKKIISDPNSITGQYLSGKLSIPLPKSRRRARNFLEVRGARENNLKNLNVRIPLGVFSCVSGVSGSGKSTLVFEVLHKALSAHFYNSSEKPGAHDKITGSEFLNGIVTIDQSPIGRTPRSNPATYTGVFGPVRDLFAMTPEANARGYQPGRFSFNVSGGRCDACEGDGIIKIEMHFLPDVYVPCEVCNGKRYNRETLEVKYKDKDVSQILDMTVDEAMAFFENIPRIRKILKTLSDVGLGYITLGQSATTLSGGEAQRIKLSRELSRQGNNTLYILDEPTTGLHFADISKLLGVLNRLVEKGNSVLVIEHNLDVIKSADYVIDLGPEGGDAGGRLIAAGTPEEIARSGTHTGVFLGRVLNKNAK